MSHTSQLCEASLIVKVKEHPHLYDIHHKDYKDSRKCIQTWTLIARDLGCWGEWKMCKERWRTLRDVYVRNRKSIMVGETMRKKPRWRFFDQMNFLDAYVNHRPPDPEVYAILAR
ncbi:Transcription factor Adf-1-like 3 [Homarus americanus]|uniref:Transcription factor Adf-1-like 3 n=1 Tax=Homarus americanus TaxID=6706 RepID=A0A8J5MY75_HOMAM|nr:Transcription factor Adf-1-like 3 [Homarus americanus]